MSGDRCPWFVVWFHRRRRRIDRAVTWRALRDTGDLQYPTDAEAAVLFALRGWAFFVQRPEQTHWRCPCSDTDRLERPT